MANREKFIITDEMIRGAESYIPYVDKLTIVAETAEACLEPVDKGTAGIATETQLPIPQLYKERCGAKQYFLMYYFLTRYLRLDIDSDAWNDEEYDYYASAHIFNRLERFKSGSVTEVKNKVFDILSDYKQLRSMLDTEVYDLKKSKNSALDRLQDSIALFSAPENIAKLNELMKKDLGELEVAQKKLAAKRGKTKAEAKPEAMPTEQKSTETK